MTRTCDWIETFVDHSKSRGSPEIFRRWAAISAVAATLERKVWLQSNFGTTYPNLYIFMVGPPGSGKSVASNQAMEYAEALDSKKHGKLHFGANNLSRASLMDSLARATREIMRPREIPNFVRYNALTVHARELQVLIPGWDTEFMAHLTDLWDCKPYREEKRGGDLKMEIPNTWLNLLGDCPPSYLGDALPISAWESGFISRTILVFSSAEAKLPLSFASINLSDFDAKHAALTSDLAAIHELYGEMLMTEDAAAAMVAWNDMGCPPRVTHPRLQNYNARRVAHLMKLCMVASAARSDELIITLDDYNCALGWLLEAERAMPSIFVAMQSGGDAIAMRDTWDYVLREGQRIGGPVRHSLVAQFLGKRVPAFALQKVLSVMVESQMLTEEMDSKGLKAYRAGETAYH